MMRAVNRTQENCESSGGRLVTADGRTLPLREASLSVTARAGIARATLTQRFENRFQEILHVTYSLPLPADGAVGGFAFRVGERRVEGRVEGREAAREHFEQAVLDGHTAALLEQERSSLFTQEIGNVPPGAEVVAEIAIDQRVAWLDEGAWEWRFPTVAAPRYLGAPGRVTDAKRVEQDVGDAHLDARVSFELSVGDTLAADRRPESPSHAIRTEAGVVTLAADDGARLDRDVVVRWPVAQPRVGLALETGRPAAAHRQAGAAYGLLTLVPPAPEAHAPAVPRDLIALLDTSGSMDGEPLAQAKRILCALVESLGEDDRLEMIAFSTGTHRWRRGPVRAVAEAKADALRWIAKLEAGGGTEMREGIRAALDPLRPEAQRQVVLFTDGLIGFEQEIVAEILQGLPATSRLHTVGVGSAVNRSLTGPAARAGRGVEIVVGLGEDPERALSRLLARTRAPVLVDLTLDGDAVLEVAPREIPDVTAGAPALVTLRLRPEGGEVRVRGRTAAGDWEERILVPAVAPGEGNPSVVRLFGREAVEDLEARVATGEAELDEEIERLGVDFQIATRRTSWVAVDETVSVDPRDPARRARVPQELPHGISVRGLGLRHAMPAGAPAPQPLLAALPVAPAVWTAPRAERPLVMKALGALTGLFSRPRREPVEVFEEPAAIAPPVLLGRLVRRHGRELVVEVGPLPGDLQWEPGDIEVAWGDGRPVPARLDVRRSTRGGRYKAGQILRLVLALDAEAPAGEPASLSLTSAGAVIEIALEGTV
jgi:Ca-activated chloride channel family protein